MAAVRPGLPDSQFFKLVATGDGIWAATATDFSAAVGNAGMVDLGGRWLVVDTFISARAATTCVPSLEHWPATNRSGWSTPTPTWTT